MKALAFLNTLRLMKLFRYDNYEVKVAPEAMALKPFRKLWDRDKSKDKSRAQDELAFLYFYCDPRSDYQYIVDDDDRMEAVKKGVGLDAGWKPDKLMEDAIALYNSFENSASLLLKVATKGVEKVRKLLDDMTPGDTKTLKEYLTVMKMIPEVAGMIQEAERKILEDEQQGEAKGSIEKTLFDDGLDEVADWAGNN